MFQKNKDIVKLDDEIFVIPNFISRDDLGPIVEYLENIDQNMFVSKAKNVWYNNKLTRPIQQLIPIYEKMRNLVMPEYEILPEISVTRLIKGESMYVHADSPGKNNKDLVTSDDPYETCHSIDYGLVLYLNDDYEGGEIYYPNRGIVYKPKCGDLVIHSSLEEYSHGVKEVLSGIRYVYSNFILLKGEKYIPKISLDKNFSGATGT
jgi:hypothetical protein